MKLLKTAILTALIASCDPDLEARRAAEVPAAVETPPPSPATELLPATILVTQSQINAGNVPNVTPPQRMDIEWDLSIEALFTEWCDDMGGTLIFDDFGDTYICQGVDY